MLPEEYTKLQLLIDNGDLKAVLRAILEYIYWENEDHEDERRND